MKILTNSQYNQNMFAAAGIGSQIGYGAGMVKGMLVGTIATTICGCAWELAKKTKLFDNLKKKVEELKGNK